MNHAIVSLGLRTVEKCRQNISVEAGYSELLFSAKAPPMWPKIH